MVILQLNSEQLSDLVQDAVRKVIRETSQNTAPPEPEQLLTVKQAADLLNLSIASIYGLTHRAVIPVCKRGKKLYFSRQELLDWIKDGRKKTAKEIDAEAERHLLQLNQTVRRRAA